MNNMSGYKRKMNWTMTQDKILIDFVKKHEPLYNVKCKEFRKKQIRLNLWRKVANFIGDKTVSECSNRWRYVRKNYMRLKGKEPTNEAARRRAEQLSSFLPYNSTPAKKSVLINCKEESLEESEEDEEFEEERVETRVEQQSPAKNLNQIIVEDLEMIPDKNSETLTTQHTKQDETDLFFASMAQSVKKLPEKERVYVRLEIASIVGNAELRYLEHQNYNDCSQLTLPSSGSSSSSFTLSEYAKAVSSQM